MKTILWFLKNIFCMMYLLENLSFCGFLKEEILIANLSIKYNTKIMGQ